MTERALAGRRIIVLGGTGGLGSSVVERLLADGASVLVADVRSPTGADRRDDVDSGSPFSRSKLRPWLRSVAGCTTRAR